VIRPGQLNLMTAGRGVAHAEDGRRSPTAGHGVQLWVAQPETTRNGAPAFAHHAELPSVDIGRGSATVLVGEFAGARSPARTDTELVGVDLTLDGTVDLPLAPPHEYGAVALEGVLELDDATVGRDELAYLGQGRDEIRVKTHGAAHVLLLGGEPFAETILMWWNFVARTREEMHEATRDWQVHAARFGEVRSDLDRIPAPPPL
jgi:quercetin 2,3-dioxygenase